MVLILEKKKTRVIKNVFFHYLKKKKKPDIGLGTYLQSMQSGVLKYVIICISLFAHTSIGFFLVLISRTLTT